MDKYFHSILYNGCNYLSMLGLKLMHVSKGGHWWVVCHFVHDIKHRMYLSFIFCIGKNGFKVLLSIDVLWQIWCLSPIKQGTTWIWKVCKDTLCYQKIPYQYLRNTWQCSMHWFTSILGFPSLIMRDCIRVAYHASLQNPCHREPRKGVNPQQPSSRQVASLLWAD